MSEQTTPKTKWYVTEYPEECDFAITDGNEIFATIIGGKTIGDQCDLASRIAKLPDLERERDEAREKAERYRLEANAIMMQRDEAREEANKLSGAYEDATNYYARIIELKEELDEAREALVKILKNE